MKLEIFMEQEKCSNAAPQNGGFALSISRAVFLRKQGSFIRHLMREIEYQTLSQRVFFFFHGEKGGRQNLPHILARRRYESMVHTLKRLIKTP